MILPEIMETFFYSASNRNSLDKIQRGQNRCLKTCGRTRGRQTRSRQDMRLTGHETDRTRRQDMKPTGHEADRTRRQDMRPTGHEADRHETDRTRGRQTRSRQDMRLTGHETDRTRRQDMKPTGHADRT